MFLGAGRGKPHNESSRHEHFERAFIPLLQEHVSVPGELQDELQKLQPTSDLSLVFAPGRNLGLVYIFVKLHVQAETAKRSSQAVL